MPSDVKRYAGVLSLAHVTVPEEATGGDVRVYVLAEDYDALKTRLEVERDEARNTAYMITCAPECTWFRPNELPWPPRPSEVWRRPGERYAPKETCDHNWVDARNEVVKSGQWCSKCNAIRPGEATQEESR